MGRSLPLHPPIPAASSSPCYWPSTGQHTARLPCVKTECTQLIGTIQPLEGFESGMRDAVRSVQGAHRCSGETGQRPSPRPASPIGAPDAPAGVWQSVAPQALGRLDLGGKRPEIERRRVCHQRVHVRTQQRPIALIHGNVTPKIQQRLRTDLIALPPARDPTVGKSGFPAGCGACSGSMTKPGE